MSLTPEIAEICGIHTGDGYLRYQGKRKEFDVSGGYEEKEYYDNHVIPLLNKAFDISVAGKYFPSRSTYGFCTTNRRVIETLASFGFPSGNKTTTVHIPRQILECEDKHVYCAFLRGYFDTDGCFTFDKKISNSSLFQRKYNYYPRIMFTTCSKDLSNGFQELVNRLGLVCRVYTYKPKKKTESLKYELQITGNKALAQWMKSIGSKNPSKICRYFIWKKFGFCPPATSYHQRIDILNGKLDPNSFYKGLWSSPDKTDGFGPSNPGSNPGRLIYKNIYITNKKR